MDNMVWSNKKEDILFFQSQQDGLTVLAKWDWDYVEMYIWGSLKMEFVPQILGELADKPYGLQDETITILKDNHWLEFYSLDGEWDRVPFTGMGDDIYFSGNIKLKRKFFNALIDFSREKFPTKYKYVNNRQVEVWMKEF